MRQARQNGRAHAARARVAAGIAPTNVPAGYAAATGRGVPEAESSSKYGSSGVIAA